MASDGKDIAQGPELQLDIWSIPGVRPLPRPYSTPWRPPTAAEIAEALAGAEARKKRARGSVQGALDLGQVPRRDEVAGRGAPGRCAKPAKGWRGRPRE